MGWTPRRTGAGSDKGSVPSPSTQYRRRKAAKQEEEETPNVRRARENSPRVSTGARQPPGKTGAPNRTAMKINLGDRWARIVADVKAGEYTWQEFVDGLDEEELARGQLRADDGTFVGRPPTFVPREFLLAAQREQKRRFEEIFGSEVLGIAQEYVKLAKDTSIPPKERAKMMQYAMERIFGGIPKEFKVSQEQPWEAMVVNVAADTGDMPEHLKRRYAGYAEREGTGEAP